MLKLVTIIGLLTFCAAQVFGDTPTLDAVPKDLPPDTATGFTAINPATHKCGLVAVVITYKGTDMIIRFDALHMHGFTVAQLVEYSDLAHNTMVYDICKADKAKLI